jgi:hypothetical protein
MIKNAKSAATRHTHMSRPRGRALLRSAAALLALATLAAPASARPFQQYLNGACSGTICKINFVKVPVGQRLLVNDVSCYVRLAPAGGGFSLRAVQLLVLGANPANVLSAVTLVPSLGAGSSITEANFASNNTISAFANAQQRFQAYVEITLGTFSQVACHISGDMVKAT